LLTDVLGISQREGRRLQEALSHAKRTRQTGADATLQHTLEAYRQALAVRNLVDYDDLIGLSVDMLETVPEYTAAYQKRFPWLCIDEYQDIDAQQYRLVRLLTPADGNLCAIGDPDQAIYGFRGADVQYFRHFLDDFPTARTIRLHRNYRSSSNIVSAATQVISAADEARHFTATRMAGQRLTLHVAPSEQAEAEFVVHTMEQLLGGHSFFSMDSGRVESSSDTALSFGDFAVLYRTEAQAEVLSEALSRSGMPFQSRSHSPLSLHPGVQALYPGLLESAATHPLAEQLAVAAKRAVEAGSVDTVTVQAALELLKPLVLAAGEDPERLLAELALASSIDTWDARADRLSLLTLHAAKGLEFAVVFVVGCEDGIIPLHWTAPRADELDEERRLFYVGMTRAREWLFLCRARRRLWRGQRRELAPSPFLEAIAEALLERQERLAAKPPRPTGTTQLPLF
jgi:DNA helicase-2/ATP-dependent DNA helicase PcrA